MAASWKWCNCGQIEHTCKGCHEPLRLYRNEIVEFTHDGETRHWHLHCLVTHLCEHYAGPPVLHSDHATPYPWGTNPP